MKEHSVMNLEVEGHDVAVAKGKGRLFWKRRPLGGLVARRVESVGHGTLGAVAFRGRIA